MASWRNLLSLISGSNVVLTSAYSPKASSYTILALFKACSASSAMLLNLPDAAFNSFAKIWTSLLKNIRYLSYLKKTITTTNKNQSNTVILIPLSCVS